MSSHVRFGVQTWTEAATFGELIETWSLIDKLQFDTAWVYDHFIPVLDRPSAPCLESWTLLSALALNTRRVRLGVLVSGNTYRHPAVLAKMATTVDHISGGRLILGIGAAWYVPDHTACGIPFYTASERIHRLDESLHVIRTLWTEPRTSFSGRYYRLQNACCEPKPVQQPRPLIMVGGGGERLTLRVAAAHADIWNTMGSPAVFSHKVDVLRRHCDSVKRDFDDIEISWVGWGFVTRSQQEREAVLLRFGRLVGKARQEIEESSLIGTPDQIESRIEEFLAAGVTHFIISILAPFDHKNLQRFSQVASRFRK